MYYKINVMELVNVLKMNLIDFLVIKNVINYCM